VAEDWQDRVKSIAAGLLTLEVNTVEKPNMSASKMPDMPLALHQIVTLYADELETNQFHVTDGLLAAAQARIDHPDDPTKLTALEDWTFQPNDTGAAALTNGPKTFEALQWAAFALKRQLETVRPASADRAAAIDVQQALLSRIIANCRQLRQVTLLLQQQFAALPEVNNLFDGTVEQTTAALFKHPRPTLVIDTDVVLLVRKAWDIGLEQVLLQTVMQVDGDVLVRVAPGLDKDKRAFYAELHRSTVETGIKQWRSLFDLVSSLIAGAGKLLFQRGA
jgi:hypothetical protein